MAWIALVTLAALAAGHYGYRTAQRSRWAMLSEAQAGRAYRPEAIPLPLSARLINEEIQPGKNGGVFAHYVADEPAEAIESFFRTAMPQAGWTETEPIAAMPSAGGGSVSAYSNDKGNWCIIAVSEGADGTAVSVLQVRGRFEKETSR